MQVKSLQETIWRQFGASLDMFENAIRACPDTLWEERGKSFQAFWYIASHTLFWTDYYFTETDVTEGSYQPPAPFGREEFDPAGLFPERIFTRDELLAVLDNCRDRCQIAIGRLTEVNADQPCGPKRPPLTNLELLLYSMRHVQHHAAQLNLQLRQSNIEAPIWVSRSRHSLQ